MFKSLLIDFVLLSGKARHEDYDESNRWVVWNENDGRYCLGVFTQRQAEWRAVLEEGRQLYIVTVVVKIVSPSSNR